MADIVSELIETKMKLAESEDRLMQKVKYLKETSDKVTALESKLNYLESENSSLLDSISQLIEEKNTLRMQLEEASGLKPSMAPEQEMEEDEFRSPDQYLPITITEDHNSVWTEVLDNWDRLGNSKKLKALSRKGIPSNLRGEVWNKVVGNPLHVTPQLFNVLLARAKESNPDAREQNGSSLIPMDLKRTLGSLQVFQKEQPLHQALNDLLEVFASYRPDIGYVQGMAYLGAILILHLGTYKAFETFANMICKSEMLRTFYSFDLTAIKAYYRVFEYFMRKKVPKILNRFYELGITPDVYLLEWVYTLFSRCFSLDVVR